MSKALPLPPAQPTKWVGIFSILIFNIILYNVLNAKLHDLIPFATRREMFFAATVALGCMGVAALSRMAGEIAFRNGRSGATNALAAISWSAFAAAIASFIAVAAILYLAVT